MNRQHDVLAVIDEKPRGVELILTGRYADSRLVEMADSGAFFFREEVDYDPEAAAKFLTPEYGGHLQAVAERIPAVEDYTKDGLEAFLRALAEERGTKLKWIAQALRVALTGKTVSPGIDEVMVTLGKERVIERIRRALAKIGAGG